MNVGPRYYRGGDGLDLAYRYYDGPAGALPVLCLPGLTRNSRDFEDLAPHLAARYPVVCPDFRGRGYSAHDPEWRNYQPPTYLADTLALLDTLSIERAAFVGTSLGGLVSMLAALQAPERVAGVVLNDIGPVIGERGLARIKSYVGRAQPVTTWDEAVDQARDVYELAWPGLSREVWLRLVRRSYREDGQGRPVLDMDPMIGEAAREAGTSPADPWALFAAFDRLPLLVLQGEHSDILTDDIVAGMRDRKPDLRHVKVRNRGHVPLLDEPDALAAVDRFLESLE